MKKATTYYFLLLLCLNAFIACYLTFAADELRNTLPEVLEGRSLPLWTQRLLDYHDWAWVAAVVALIGAITSLMGKVSERILTHTLVCFLILELWMMFTVTAALVAPWVRLGP